MTDPKVRSCEDGIHDVTVASAPIDHGECVNVDYSCAVCGVVVWSASWTKAAWEAEQAKQQAKAARRAARA